MRCNCGIYASGSGKSRFLASLYVGLLKAGLSATLIDPHGDLARLVLAHLVADGWYEDPTSFTRLLYLDLPAAARQGRYAPFNILRTRFDSETTTKHVVEAFKRAWPSLDSGVAVRFENIVLAGTSLLVEHGVPLPHLHELLTDDHWREELLSRSRDESVVSFFRHRFDRWGKEQPLLIESTLNRVYLLTYTKVLKYSLLQQDNLFDFRQIMDSNRSLIVNLALGDTDSRRLLGSLLTVSAEQGALSRAELAPDTRHSTHYLVIDEFSEFTEQSETALSRMLSATRKFGLFLVMSHQTWSQV